MPSVGRWSGPLLFAALLAGCLLRVTGLAVHSFWYDEAQMAWTAAHDDLWGVLRQDRHPPLSFLAFRAWGGLVGTGDAALRLLPALGSCLTLGLFAWVARRMLQPVPALVATAVFALAPFQVWYAQELRMYWLVELGAVVALLGVEWARAGRRGAGAVAVGLGCAVALGSHYFGCLAAALAATLGLALWRTDRRATILVVAAAAAGCVVWVPWLIAFVPDQVDAPWGFYSQLSARDLAELPVRHLLIHWQALPAGLVYAVAAIAWLGLGGCIGAALRVDGAPARRLLAGLAVPMLALFALFLVMPPNFQPHYLTALAPVVTLAVAYGLGRIRRWRLGAVLSAALVLACGFGTLWLRRGNLKEDYRAAVAELAVQWRPGDVVVAVTGTPEGPSQAGVRHYLQQRPEVAAAVRDLGEVLGEIAAGRPPARVHAIYRVREYALPFLRQLQTGMRQVRAGTERHWIQHIVFER